MRAQRAGRRIGPFDRTYEGLKRSIGQEVQNLPDWAFDRTYEGLKPGKGLPHHRLAPRPLTVPMRV